MNVERKELADRIEVTLKEYMEAKFVAIEHNLVLARQDMERRLSEMNNIRNEVLTDRKLFVTTDVYHTTVKEWSLWREATANRLTVIETRSVTWTAALGMFFILTQIILYWFAHK